MLTDEHGVFVSPLGDPEGGDGTRENPFASVNEAILAAKAAGKLVFACATEGAFEEPLQIGESGDGARLYGGFSCSDWSYTAEVRTLVQSPTSTGLRVQDLVDGLTIEDFEIVASDGKQPGESSMGAFVTNSVNVTFKRVSLTAGDGADGADGEGTTEKAQPGADGNPGTAACSGGTENPGGEQVETMCNGVPSGSIGGQGGPGGKNASTAGNGDPGLPALGAGVEGKGEGTGWSCATSGNGQSGENGTSQPTAAGGTGIGVIAPAGYVSVSGEAGKNGTVGQGGGGGGGAKAPVSCGEGKPLTGASGGSGGGGGCGGKGGQGGKGGGASFALASVNSAISLSAVVLSAGKGGDGGKGGHGQPGGDGGARGGDADGSSSPKSCKGGDGGQGGNGGHGGGGIGGPSVGIAYVGEEPSQKDVEITVASVPAKGGLDGAGLTAGAGEDGLVAKKQEFSSN